MSHFHVLLIVWAKSQDSVHKPQFMKRKESRSGSNRGPSAYQPSALSLGHIGLAGALSELGHSLQILLFCQLFHNMFAQMTYPETELVRVRGSDGSLKQSLGMNGLVPGCSVCWCLQLNIS